MSAQGLRSAIFLAAVILAGVVIGAGLGWGLWADGEAPAAPRVTQTVPPSPPVTVTETETAGPVVEEDGL